MKPYDYKDWSEKRKEFYGANLRSPHPERKLVDFAEKSSTVDKWEFVGNKCLSVLFDMRHALRSLYFALDFVDILSVSQAEYFHRQAEACQHYLYLWMDLAIPGSFNYKACRKTTLSPNKTGMRLPQSRLRFLTNPTRCWSPDRWAGNRWHYDYVLPSWIADGLDADDIKRKSERYFHHSGFSGKEFASPTWLALWRAVGKDKYAFSILWDYILAILDDILSLQAKISGLTAEKMPVTMNHGDTKG